MPANNSIILDVLDPASATIDGLNADIVLTTAMDPTISVKANARSVVGDGGLVFDLTGQRLPLKYEYYATVLVTRQTVDTVSYLDSSIRKTIRLSDAGNGTDFTAVDLGSWAVPVQERTVSIATKKVEVQTAYDAYVTAKTAYESTLANAQSIELEQVELYEPSSPTYIVTRLLEFQTGTLGAAIRYATDAQLDTELDYLNRINKFIKYYTDLYPSITIGDGEGIPYQ